MTEETVEQFLSRRERELMSRAAALRGQLLPIETELAHVQKMRALMDAAPRLTIETPSGSSRSRPPITEFRGGAAVANPVSLALIEAGAAENLYASRTIKDLVIQALIDGFPEGATAPQLREFMQMGFFRTVDPGSLRTQLHRLKAAGILGQEPAGDLWNFRDGKRSLYAKYNHPTSRKGMAELQDEPPTSEQDEAFLKKLGELAWREKDDAK